MMSPAPSLMGERLAQTVITRPSLVRTSASRATVSPRSNAALPTFGQAGRVEPGSPAAQARIGKNELIQEVEGKPVTDAAGFAKLLADARTANQRVDQLTGQVQELQSRPAASGKGKKPRG